MTSPGQPALAALVGRRLQLPGHFEGMVTIESARPLGSGAEKRVRLSTGELDEAVLSADDLAGLIDSHQEEPETAHPVDAEKLRLLVESARIRLAYAYDRQFAVSLSGIRTRPHQIEAVYLRMLLQPRLCFLLANDPGAGRTIVAGLLIEELKLREAIERVLILVPAPLSIQWQDELMRLFGETFRVIHAGNDQQHLINLWQRETQVVASLDYAKQDDVRERVWQQCLECHGELGGPGRQSEGHCVRFLRKRFRSEQARKWGPGTAAGNGADRVSLRGGTCIHAAEVDADADTEPTARLTSAVSDRRRRGSIPS